LSELEEVTANYLDFYFGLAFASPTMGDVNFSNTRVRQTGFNSLEGTGFTDVEFAVSVKFNPTSAEPMIPDKVMVTRMVRDAFTVTDPDWVGMYISRLQGLPTDNGFRSTNSVDYIPVRPDSE
jgi:hypothetical protein